MLFRVNGNTNRLMITSTGNLEIGSSAGTGSDYSLLDGMVINTANGSAGLIINSSSSSHNAYLSFGYGSGSGTSHHDQFSAYIGRLGDNQLVFGTNNGIRGIVDASGNFGINNTTPGSFHSSGQNLVVGSGSGEEGMTIYSGNTSNGVINFADSTSGSDSYEGRIVYSHNNSAMTFHVGDGTERIRIVDGGRLFVGTNGAININGVTTGHTFYQVDDFKWIMGLRCELTNKVGLAIRYAAGGNDHDVILFEKDSTVKFVVHGTGNVSNANNSYGQTSDVSLKENIVDANSQWNDIKNVKVRNFNFKSETGLPDHTQIGVVAQELETTSPKLVTENEEGIKEVGYSVLYMKSVKALQEAITRIETLESEVAALKGS